MERNIDTSSPRALADQLADETTLSDSEVDTIDDVLDELETLLNGRTADAFEKVRSEEVED